MSAAISSETIPLKCERFLIDWQIKNLILCSGSKNILLETPVFLLSNSSTWRLEFGRHCMNAKLSCGLRRCDVAMSGSVYVQFQCCIKNSMGRIWCTKKSDLGVCDARCSVWRLQVENEFFKEVQSFVDELLLDDTNTFCFEIMFYYSDGRYAKLSDGDACFILTEREYLAKHMLKCIITGKHSDVVLRVKNKEFKVHKAILFAGSSLFAQLLADDPSRSTIELLDIEQDVMEILLIYMYSGWSNVPREYLLLPFGLYEYAQKFEVSNLKTMLAPNKLKYSSEMFSDQCIYKWRIPNFSTHGPTNRLLSSSIKSKPTSKEEFRFILCLGPQDSRGGIGIFVEMLEGDCHLQVLFRVSLMLADNHLRCTKQVVGSLEKNKMFGFNTFLDGNFLDEEGCLILPADTTLTVCCNLKFSTTKHNVVSTCMPKMNFWRKFGKEVNFQNFPQLREKEIFPDIILTVQGTNIYAHRIVLSACSVVFESLINELEERNENSLTIVGTPPLLNAMLEFIYTRNIELTVDMAIGLYYLSWYFQILGLHRICSRFLHENLVNGSVF